MSRYEVSLLRSVMNKPTLDWHFMLLISKYPSHLTKLLKF